MECGLLVGRSRPGSSQKRDAGSNSLVRNGDGKVRGAGDGGLSQCGAPSQKDALYAASDRLRRDLAAARVDEIILFTSEHWGELLPRSHFRLLCRPRRDVRRPYRAVAQITGGQNPGDPDLATTIVESCYEKGIEPGYAYELAFDHGTMIPLHFLRPEMDLPVVPIFFNTLASPQPSARRCLELGKIVGKIVGDIARRSNKRIVLVAIGGMSHDPGEQRHGWIDGFLTSVFCVRWSRETWRNLRITQRTIFSGGRRRRRTA